MLLDIKDQKITDIMKSFYMLTQIRMAIVDIDCHEIMGYPESFTDFCAYLRSVPESCAKCEYSDHQAFEMCRKTGDIYIYKCHAGLTEAAYPLRDKETIIGFIMFGQVTDIKNRNGLRDMILMQCQDYPVSPATLKKAISKLKYKSAEELIAVAMIFETCINYILQKQLVTARGEQMARKLDRFIVNHLADDLTVPVIARELRISRTRLYTLSHQYLGIGIAEYIKRKRVDKAKELLSDTALSFSEIAEQLGFSDINYFRRCFRSSEGMSLKAFRNQTA